MTNNREHAGDPNRRRRQARVTIMLDRTSSSAEKISGIVAEILSKRVVTRPVGLDDDLRELMTSMDMVNLMLTIEAAFDLKLPDRAMTPANFRSIAAIDALVTTLA